MSKRRFLGAASLTVLISLQLQCAIAASIFREMPLDTARNTAKQEGKFLIVDFTAAWCGPCHAMEKDTWANDEVQKWINGNALAIQIDVDKDKPIASDFNIRAMPSVLVFNPKDYSKEFDRHVGYQNSTEILQWFEGVKRGESQLDLLKHTAEKSLGKGGKTEIEARRKYGRACIEAGKYEPALEEYVWLWQNIAKEDPSAKALRSSYLAAEIVALTSKNEAAKSRFRKFRDEAEKNDPLDYVVLNEVLGDQSKTLEWFDKVKNDPTEAESLKKISYRIERLLINKGRWADLALLYPQPIEELKVRMEVSKAGVASLAQMGIKVPDPFCADAAKLYAAYLAAHHDSTAKKIALECIKMNDTPLMRKQLVITALEAQQARKEQYKWILDNPELTEKLDEALKRSKPKAK